MVPRCRRNGGFYLLVMTAVFFSTVKDQTTNRPETRAEGKTCFYKTQVETEMICLCFVVFY